MIISSRYFYTCKADVVLPMGILILHLLFAGNWLIHNNNELSLIYFSCNENLQPKNTLKNTSSIREKIPMSIIEDQGMRSLEVEDLKDAWEVFSAK